MKKILTLIVLGVACLMPNKAPVNVPEITNAINEANIIEITVDNINTTLTEKNPLFDEILSQLDDMLEGSHEMPAFGVSLDNETKEAKKTGVWLELKYSATHSHNEMPFDSLLIEVQKDWTGFNIYRGNKGIYEGRCFYINLVDNNMDNLYEYIINT